MPDIVIVGAGGQGREVYAWVGDWISSRAESPAGYRIKGFLDTDPQALDDSSIDAEILGTEDDYRPGSRDVFVLGLGDIDTRRAVVGKLRAKGADFLTVVHPSALVVPTAQLGQGVLICPFVLVSDNVRIGDFALVNFHASCGHDAVVGEHANICPHATLNGFAMLEESVFVGSHATITASRRIGAGAKIGAQAVVLKDVPARTLVVGVPGKHYSIDSGA